MTNLIIILALLPLHASFATSTLPARPSYLDTPPNEIVYYFGVGSNMLRSKLENRGTNGTSITVKSIQPAIVPNHRLAFNMRGFPPLEPGMGSLEPTPSDRDECHGALCEMTREEVR